MTFAFFAEMAWKSALISAAALMLAMLLRSRSAADRALVLRLGVTMLLLLPPIALALPALQIEAWAAPAAAPLAALGAAELEQLASLASPGLQPVEPTIWDDPTPLLILAYLGGLLMVGSRLLGGLWMLSRWTRSARDVTDPAWLEAFDRTRWAASNGERLRLMVSDCAPSPLSWGWRDPVILIDPDTLEFSEEADAILAHEVAHVARRDWPVLMVTRLAATLFWFNPLVWLLEREVVQQAEEAADCAAAECVEPARYARTLLSWAPVSGGALPAHSIAPSASALARRVRAILDGRVRERPSDSAWTALAMLACIGIAAPVAAMELVEATAEAEAEAASSSETAAPVAAVPEAVVAAPRDGETILFDGEEIGAAAAAAADEALAAVLPQIPTIVASATASLHPEEMSRTVEEALRAAGVEARRVNRAEIEAAMREAHRAAATVRVQVPRAEIERVVREAHRTRVVVDSADIQRRVREAQRTRVVVPRAEIERARREAERAGRTVRVSMAHGAEGMMRGAAGMERGAQNMIEESRRLRDRDYRERQIARARARGETVTHEDLLEAAEGLQEGAEGMREGAREMREAAERMRDGRD